MTGTASINAYVYQGKLHHDGVLIGKPVDSRPLSICQVQALPCQAQTLTLAGEYLAALVLPCSSWLFLIRVRAAPRHALSKVMMSICTFLWILTFTSLLAPTGIKMIGTPRRGVCTFTYSRRLICIPAIVLVAFDTAVMVAGLVGFMTHNHNSSASWYSEMKATMMTKNMGPISQAFLRSGYIYYLFVSTSFLPII